MNARTTAPRLAVSATLAALAVLAVIVAACAPGGGASPAPSSPAPTPTPIAVKVETPEDAAALVIAADPRFAGTIKLRPDIIGASRWWEGEALPGGGFRITVTIGWGDCPSGCISRHVWIYGVTADGQVNLEAESGDPIPSGNPLPG